MLNRASIFGLASAAIGISVAATALADSFSFTFSVDNTAISGSGTLQANANGGGSFTATSGTGTVTGIPDGSVLTLIANPNAPSSFSTSPSGAFWYDDQLLPQSANPLLTVNGLLFGVGSGAEINIWGNSPDNYSLWLHNAGGDVIQLGGPNVHFNYASVPEASTMLFGLAGVMPLMSLRRRQRAAATPVA